MFSTSCAHSHHDVTFFKVDGIKILKNEYLQNGKRLFHKLQNLLSEKQHFQKLSF